jgi:mRNA interferase MazF
VRRGEVWTASGGADYASKPRPVVIVQDDQFPLTQSVTTCSFTTTMVNAGFVRVRIEPSEPNGLKAMSCIMVDKVTTIPRSKLGRRIGHLSAADLESLNRALAIFLGLAG